MTVRSPKGIVCLVVLATLASAAAVPVSAAGFALFEQGARGMGFAGAYVAQTQEQFSICPVCRRVYWRGTHWQHMKERLARLESGQPLSARPVEPPEPK